MRLVKQITPIWPSGTRERHQPSIFRNGPEPTFDIRAGPRIASSRPKRKIQQTYAPAHIPNTRRRPICKLEAARSFAPPGATRARNKRKIYSERKATLRVPAASPPLRREDPKLGGGSRRLSRRLLRGSRSVYVCEARCGLNVTHRLSPALIMHAATPARRIPGTLNPKKCIRVWNPSLWYIGIHCLFDDSHSNRQLFIWIYAFDKVESSNCLCNRNRSSLRTETLRVHPLHARF